jgi:hypothetical protein
LEVVAASAWAQLAAVPTDDHGNLAGGGGGGAVLLEHYFVPGEALGTLASVRRFVRQVAEAADSGVQCPRVTPRDVAALF